MAVLCRQCKTVVHAFNGKMVMLKDDIWRSVCNDPKETLCAGCIEKKLGREIQVSDFKECEKPIPVNVWYARNWGMNYAL